jgi:hypothetical protein
MDALLLGLPKRLFKYLSIYYFCLSQLLFEDIEPDPSSANMKWLF